MNYNKDGGAYSSIEQKNHTWVHVNWAVLEQHGAILHPDWLIMKNIGIHGKMRFYKISLSVRSVQSRWSIAPCCSAPLDLHPGSESHLVLWYMSWCHVYPSGTAWCYTPSWLNGADGPTFWAVLVSTAQKEWDLSKFATCRAVIWWNI